MSDFKFLDVEKEKKKPYIRITKELYNNPYYRKSLSNDAIILYAFLQDRLSLSISNEVRDENGESFVIATIESLMKVMKCSKNTVRKAFKELEVTSLILFRDMAGYNNNRKIYLGEIDTKRDNSDQESGSKSEGQVVKNIEQESKKFAPIKGQKKSPNNTNINKTNFNKSVRGENYSYTNDYVFED